MTFCHHIVRTVRSVIPVFALLAALNASSQTSLSIYADGLVNGFDDWSWASHDLNNPAPVHTGTRSISVDAAYWEGISFHHADLDVSSYLTFSFWADGGSSGGQKLQVYAEHGTNAEASYVLPEALAAGTWQHIVIPLGLLNVSNASDFNRINIQLRNDGTSGTFYLDDIELTAMPAPELVHVSVNTTDRIHTVDERHFGVNLAMWDTNYDASYFSTTAALLEEMGCRTVRMPGGSLSDQYHWASNTTLSNTWKWAASFTDMTRVATNADVQAIITVNYGTGTPAEAAAWVRYANITNHLGFKYWEIGNECYGTWETDSNTFPHDAYTYAVRAADYMAQMRAADPTIKIGVVSTPGEDANVNGYTNHPAYNPRTGETHYGWTPVVLTTLKNLGAAPDFLVHHVYPEWTDPNNPSQSPDNDLSLLGSTGGWKKDAADLRQMITDYFGTAGTNIELVVTENNADAGAQGRQSTSLVNALYYADSFNQVLKTEFNGFVWWDFRNGTDHGGFFGADLYGWRDYGDLGMINGLDTRHPTFYAARLMQWFARPGDQILDASSDYYPLSVGAARRTNGAVTVLVINKSLTTNLAGQIALTGFIPSSTATIRSYGVPQDEAARTGGTAQDQDIAQSSFASAATNFSYDFPPLSLTLFTFTPAPPSLLALAPPTDDKFAFQLRGQPGVPYVIQRSTNLNDWVSLATNTLNGFMLDITNQSAAGASREFWRAVWQP